MKSVNYGDAEDAASLANEKRQLKRLAAWQGTKYKQLTQQYYAFDGITAWPNGDGCSVVEVKTIDTDVWTRSGYFVVDYHKPLVLAEIADAFALEPLILFQDRESDRLFKHNLDFPYQFKLYDAFEGDIKNGTGVTMLARVPVKSCVEIKDD